MKSKPTALVVLMCLFQNVNADVLTGTGVINGAINLKMSFKVEDDNVEYETTPCQTCTLDHPTSDCSIAKTQPCYPLSTSAEVDVFGERCAELVCKEGSALAMDDSEDPTPLSEITIGCKNDGVWGYFASWGGLPSVGKITAMSNVYCTDATTTTTTIPRDCNSCQFSELPPSDCSKAVSLPCFPLSTGAIRNTSTGCAELQCNTGTRIAIDDPSDPVPLSDILTECNEKGNWEYSAKIPGGHIFASVKSNYNIYCTPA